MSKVKWGAKHDYEFVENYKILQQVFLKNEIKRYIDVDKLVKAKYQDNLEFLQWMKRFFDIKYNGQAYDAVGRRKGHDLFYILGGGKVAVGGASSGPTAANKAPSKMAPASKPMASGAAVSKPKPSAGVSGSKAKVESGDVGKLQSEIHDMRMNMDVVEKERDFYFGKLRDIEVLLQANESKKTPLTESILKILYASEEEKVHIDDNGNLSITALPGGGAGTGGGPGTGDDQMLAEDGAGGDEDMLEEADEKQNQ